MSSTWMHACFRPLKRVLPAAIWRPLRGVVTAVATPLLFSLRSGHGRSSLAGRALFRDGRPIPWYTYPCVELLLARDFTGRRILEIGGGGSTLFWAERAASVVTLEGPGPWLEWLHRQIAERDNVRLIQIAAEDAGRCVQEATAALAAERPFDLIVIDGLWRSELIDLAVAALKPDGAILCDDAEGYGIFDGFRGRGFMRADLFGYAAGTVNPHCSSIFFRGGCFLFSDAQPIPDALTLRP